ncbi:9376_t:CDS:2, partial [Dentiscutata erythropus]
PPEKKNVKQMWKKEQRIKKLGSIIISTVLNTAKSIKQSGNKYKKPEEVTGSDAHNDLFNNGDVSTFIQLLRQNLLERSPLYVYGLGNGQGLSIELKYIQIAGLLRAKPGKTRNTFKTSEHEKFDKELEGMDEEALLKMEYKYFSKDDEKYVRTTVGTVLQNGIRQLTDSGIRCFSSWVSDNIVEANRWVSQHEHYKV